jgi:hypothetical protein
LPQVFVLHTTEEHTCVVVPTGSVSHVCGTDVQPQGKFGLGIWAEFIN